MTRHGIALVLVGLVLLGAHSRRVDAQNCSPLNPQYTGLNSHSTVRLVYNGQSVPLTQGAAKWNDACGAGVPTFSVQSQPQPGGLNITVMIFSGKPTGCQNPGACGCFQGSAINGELVGGSVRIGLEPACGNAATNVAHELGHVLGLSDATDPSCVLNIMYAQIGPGANVQPEDCGAADGLWKTGAETDPGEPVPPEEQDVGTPILIDLDRNRFHLAGLADSVLFDIDADGHDEELSWTAAGALDAFLYLDRNGNGSIDNGAELFGDRTPLIDGSFAPNGYIPLAELDLIALGGNGNGFIDRDDLAYQELGLWIDWDHDGVPEAGELLTLSDAGVTRIGLQYWTTRIRDRHGNFFRYVGRVWMMVNGLERSTWSSDVFFVVMP